MRQLLEVKVIYCFKWKPKRKPVPSAGNKCASKGITLQNLYVWLLLLGQLEIKLSWNLINSRRYGGDSSIWGVDGEMRGGSEGWWRSRVPAAHSTLSWLSTSYLIVSTPQEQDPLFSPHTHNGSFVFSNTHRHYRHLNNSPVFIGNFMFGYNRGTGK